MPPLGYDEPSVSPVSRSSASNSQLAVPSGAKLSMDVWTHAAWPWRTPPAPMGWNQCAYDVAPRSIAQSRIALAILFARSSSPVHSGDDITLGLTP